VFEGRTGVYQTGYHIFLPGCAGTGYRCRFLIKQYTATKIVATTTKTTITIITGNIQLVYYSTGG
jgi:hypothetical protein